MKFADPSYKNYVAAYGGRRGGRLLAVSATDGKQLADYRLPAAPAWDSLAVANKHVFICLGDGTVQCLGQEARSDGSSERFTDKGGVLLQEEGT